MAAQLAQRPRIRRIDLDPADVQGSRVHRLQAQQGPCGRGLPGAGLADQGVGAAARDREGHVRERTDLALPRAEGAGDTPHVDLQIGARRRMALVALGAQAREAVRVQTGYVRLQRPGVGRAGRGEDGVGGAGLLDRAVLQHHHLVGAGGGDGEVVGDQQDADPQLAAQLVEQVQDLLLHGHVEGRGRLVRDQQARPGQDRERDEHPLQLPAGELVGEGVRDALRLGQAHPLERRDDERLALRTAARPGDQRRGLEGLRPDRAHGVQGRARVLRHEAQHPSAQGQELPLAQAGDLPAPHRDGAVHAGSSGSQQAQHGAGDRGLPGAGLADQRESPPLAHGEGDPADHLGGAVGDVQVLDLQQRGARVHRFLPWSR